MTTPGGVLGKSAVFEQLMVWGVLNQLLSGFLIPVTTELSNLENAANPNLALPMGSAADAAARKILDRGTAEGEAKKSGLDTDMFAVLFDAAQHAPDLSTVYELLRRQAILIPGDDPKATSLFAALTDAGIRPEWHPLMAELAVNIPTVAEVMNAWLEGQIEEPEALDRFLKAGGDPTWFQTSYNANGQAPTPVQAIDLWNRGIIPEGGTGPAATSYEQAFLEGPWRNKWLTAFKALKRYLPPPRTITAMYHQGSYSHDEAAQLLAWQGLEPADIAAYLKDGQTAKASTDKHLTKTELLAMYHDRLIDRAAASSALTQLGYASHDADELLALTDVRAAASQTNAAVTRTRTLYLAAKITRAAAIATLGKLGVPAVTVTDVVDVWDLQHAAKVKTLTPAQIVTAWYYKLLTQAEAVARLRADGYDEADAVLLLAIHDKGPIAGIPAGQPGGPLPGAGK